MFVKILEFIGKFLVLVTFLGLVIGIVLILFGWKLKRVWPPELEPPDASVEVAPHKQEATFQLTETLIFPGDIVINTSTLLPVSDNWGIEGVGKVEAYGDFVKINTNEKTTVFDKNSQFHNSYIDLVVNVKHLDNNGSYSVILRRVDPCQFYDIKFSKIDNNYSKIEVFKYFCNGGYNLLNQANVRFDIYQPHELSVGISGGNEVSFIVEIDNSAVLNIKDTNDFIWRGDFGLSVENGNVEFNNIQITE